VRKALFSLLVLVAAQSLAAADFRGTSWLMSRDEVAASEGTPGIPVADENGRQQVLFKTSVDGKSCSITYSFENDALVSASYSFRADLNREAYESMKKRITGGYGAPAMEKGDMLAWRLPRTEIALTWLPDKSCYVVYWQKEYFARINGLTSTESR
jgi:hypothetical protein